MAGQTLVVSVGDLVVSPSAVTFPNVEADLVYVMTINVRNRGRNVSRLRITPPTTSHFTVNYVPTDSIAPGMSMAADVEFHVLAEELVEGTPPLGEFLDTIKVTNGTDQVEVPLRAMLPAPKIEFNRVLEMGYVVAGTTMQKAVTIVNNGGRPARWKLTFDSGVSLEAEPSSGLLAPSQAALMAAGGMPSIALGSHDDDASMGSQTLAAAKAVQDLALAAYQEPNEFQVLVTLKASAAAHGGAPFRAVGKFEIEGAVTQLLDVSASVAEQHMSLVFRNSKRPIKVGDFGNTLYGEEAVIEALLVNDGPVPLPFCVINDVDRAGMETMQRQMAEDLAVAPPPAQGAGGAGGAGGGAGGGAAGAASEGEGAHILEAMVVTPAEGTVPPYSSVPCQLKFKPVPPTVHTGFTKGAREALAVPQPFAVHTVIESVETKQSVVLDLVGRASSSNVVITMGSSDGVATFAAGGGGGGGGGEPNSAGTPPPAEAQIRADNVRFGECPQYERRDVLVTVRNTSMAAVKYAFTKVANFEAKPSGGLLQPMQAVSTVLTFRPSQLGKFKKRLKLVVAGGCPLEVPVWVSGISSTVSESKPALRGGLDKLPQDFKPSLNFIDPAVASGTVPRGQGLNGSKFVREKPYECVDLLQSTAWDESVPNQPVATAHLTYSVQDLARRQEHKEQYNDWLKGAAQKRSDKETNLEKSHKASLLHPTHRHLYSRFDATGVPTHDNEGILLAGEEVARLREGSNMGMERGLESMEPELDVVPTNGKNGEPLWLLRSKDGEGGGAAKRAQADEKKLLTKKFKPQPTTQAEMRECSAELSTSEHHKVVCSHKSLDFSRMCIGSTSARSLAFTNDLTRAVLVRLGKLEPELASSVPEAQVIPAGATAGFDIYVSSDVEETLRRVLTYSINDKHTHKVAVVAEVVPIELVLSTKELTFDFPNLDEDATTAQLAASVTLPMTLVNPGNCDAEFFWANRGAFSVSPEQGKLEPGQTAHMEVTWTPVAGQPNMQSLALHVTGGEDQQLTVTGNLLEAKCAFTACRKLDAGLIPAGLPFVTTVELSNVGKNPAVCFVEDFDIEATGVTVEPNALRIPVGGSATLTVTILPPCAQSYEGLALEVNVRGSKYLKLPLSCEAILPDVMFYQEEPQPPQVLPPSPSAALAAIEGGAQRVVAVSQTEPRSPSRGKDAAAAAASAAALALTDELAIEAVLGNADVSCLDFQDVTIGGQERITVTLVNKSPIVAALLLDLADVPDFTATQAPPLPPTAAMLQAGVMGPLEEALLALEANAAAARLALEAPDETTSKSTTTQLKRGNGVPPSGAAAAGSTRDQLVHSSSTLGGADGGGGGGGAGAGAGADSLTKIAPVKTKQTMSECRNYAITIAPFKTIRLHLDYVPSAAVLHDFSLPLRLKGLAGEASVVAQAQEAADRRRKNPGGGGGGKSNSITGGSKNINAAKESAKLAKARALSLAAAKAAGPQAAACAALLGRRVQATGLRPRLVMSQAVVDFGDRVVSRDPSRRIPFSAEVTFTNSSASGVTWVLNDEVLREPPPDNGCGGGGQASGGGGGGGGEGGGAGGSPVGAAGNGGSGDSGDGGGDGNRNSLASGGDDILLTQPIFFISPKNGDLAPGETITIRVTFSPQGNQDYEAKIPLYLEDQPDKTRPYLTLTLCGSGVFPRIDFSTQELVLQTVPLGVESRGVFTITNNGYDELSLQHHLPVQTPVTLGVEYPDGNLIGLTSNQIRVEVSFSSDVPVSFHTTVELVDSEGKQYSVAVLGCTDNSTLTTHSFLQAYSHNFGYYTRDGKPVQFMGLQRISAFERQELREKDKARRVRAAQRALEGEEGGGGKTPKPKLSAAAEAEAKAKAAAKEAALNKEPTLAEELAKVSDEAVDCLAQPNVVDARLPEFLKAWLNANVVASQLEQPFPLDFVSSHGKLALDAIDAMSGKRCPGRLKKLSHDKAQQWKELLGQHSAMLLFLKERGALLNTVGAKDLLGFENYLLACEDELERQQLSGQGEVQRVSATQLREKRSAWESGFEATSAAAWCAVMLQAVRAFVLARLTPKAFSSLPGVLLTAGVRSASSSSSAGGKQGGASGGKGGKRASNGSDGGADPELGKSNVYTVAEGLLLKWVAYHVNATTPSATLSKRITDFDSSWSDGAILCHLMHSHQPALYEGESSAAFSASSDEPPPVLAGYTQVPFVSELKDPKVRKSNFQKAFSALASLRVGLELTEDLLTDPQPCITVLFALHLYMFLPQLIPRSTVDFGATLGTTTSKAIELRNPASKAVRYVAKLEGSADFKLPKAEVTIPANGKTEFVVELEPRFSAPVEARLTLLAQRAGAVQASHMVFVVRSRVDSRLPQKTLEVSTACYEPVSVDVEVVNPFEGAATFEVSLKQECLEAGIRGGATKVGKPGAGAGAVAQKGQGKKKRGDADTRSEEEKAITDALQKPFACRNSALFLEAGAKGKLNVSVIPFSPGVFKCEAVLLSADHGELSFEVVATVGLPKPSDTLSLSVLSNNDGSTVQRILRIPQKNLALETALNALLERLPAAMRTKCRAAGQALCRPPPLPPPRAAAAAASSSSGGKGNKAAQAEAAQAAQAAAAAAASESPSLTITYGAEADSPYFSVAGQLAMDGGGGGGGGTGGGGRGASRGGGGGGGGMGANAKNAVLEEVTSDTDPKELNALTVNFNPREAGQYPCRLMLSGFGAVGMDLRCFHLNCTVATPPVSTHLDFKAPARQTIQQLLPLVNRGPDEWTLTANLTGAKEFSGPKTFKVAAATKEGPSKVGYPLTFAAPWPKSATDGTIGEEDDEGAAAAQLLHGKLVLKNGKSGATFEYEFSGESEEPLAEAHLVKRCNAREAMDIEVKVPCFFGKPAATTTKDKNGANHANAAPPADDGLVECLVESDMPFVSGPPTVLVPSAAGGEAATYVLRCLPQMGGSYTGAVTFKHPSSGEYVWYTLEVNVDSPLEEHAIDLNATVRQVVSMSLELQNPLDEEIHFDVALTGDGVIGDSHFSLAASASGLYELFYSPLVAKPLGHSGSVAFLNDRVGEFWYKLNLSSDPAQPTALRKVSAPVGTSVVIPVPAENPLGKEVTLTATVSNSANFSVDPHQIVLGPYASSTVELTYTPSSLKVPELTTVSLSNEEVGEWVYTAEGRGELPGVMPEQRPVATIDEPTSCMLSFRNPFKDPLSVDIVLRNDSDPAGNTEAGGGFGDTFTLLMRKAERLSLAPFATLQIPVSFNPTSISEKRGVVEVRGSVVQSLAGGGGGGGGSGAGVPLNWVFPLRGVVNAPPHPKALSVRCKAKTSVRVVLEFPLRDLDGVTGPETFDYELEVPANMAKVVGQSLTLNPVATTLSDPFEPVKYQAVFEPMRPFATSLKLFVVRKSGGRWPFELQVEATEPEPDDSVTVEAALKQTGTVSFRLVNRFPTFAPYQAFFSSDSAVSLSVSPSSGLLAPPGAPLLAGGQQGTAINVSFTPLEYGMRQRGRLIVLTEDTQWTYEVTGDKPKDKPHAGAVSVLDTKQTHQLSSQKPKGGPKGSPGKRRSVFGGPRGVMKEGVMQSD